MRGYDIFAWIVLIILIAVMIFVFCLAPRAHREIARTSVAGCGAGGRVDHADPGLSAVADCADLGLCRCARAACIREGAAMMVALMARFYGPKQEFFEKKWILPDAEKMGATIGNGAKQ